MSFPRYPAYKDSGVEWLGQVPEHWNRTALKFLADYQNGYPFKPDERGETGLPIIRISQLTGDGEPAYYSGTLDERVKVRNGDLLFSWSATIDSYIWNKGEAWLNQHIFRVSPSKEADKRYLYYAIKHVAPKLADFDAHGSTMRHIKKESLGEKIYVPSVFDQGLIATFLDRETAKIDALIAEQQRLIELLKEKRQAVISRSVTKGLNPDAPMKDSGVEWLGEVPEHWAVGKLSYYALVSTGATPDRQRPDYWGGEIPWIKTGEVRYEDIHHAEECITELALKETSCDLLEPGTLLMALYGQGVTRGRVGLLAIPAACNQACAAIKPFPVLNSRFLELYFVNAYAHIRSLGNETTQQNLNLDYVRGLEVLLPPQEGQDLIWQSCGERIKGIDSLIGCSFDVIALLQERRSALISAAVTGQIDVRGLVPEASAA